MAKGNKGIGIGIIKLISGIIIIKSISGRKENLIKVIIGLEIILLGIGILMLHISLLLDDIIGATITLKLLPLAGAESAVALAIYIAYYPNRGTLVIS